LAYDYPQEAVFVVMLASVYQVLASPASYAPVGKFSEEQQIPGSITQSLENQKDISEIGLEPEDYSVH